MPGDSTLKMLNNKYEMGEHISSIFIKLFLSVWTNGWNSDDKRKKAKNKNQKQFVEATNGNIRWHTFAFKKENFLLVGIFIKWRPARHTPFVIHAHTTHIYSCIYCDTVSWFTTPAAATMPFNTSMIFYVVSHYQINSKRGRELPTQSWSFASINFCLRAFSTNYYVWRSHQRHSSALM